MRPASPSGPRRCCTSPASSASTRKPATRGPATRRAASSRWSSGSRATSSSDAASPTMPIWRNRPAPGAIRSTPGPPTRRGNRRWSAWQRRRPRAVGSHSPPTISGCWTAAWSRAKPSSPWRATAIRSPSPTSARPHRERVRIWRDATCLADHPRAPDGARQRVIDPAHFAPLFPAKPRAQAMLYREVLLGLGGRAPAFLSELSRRHRARLREEILAVYALYEQAGSEALLPAMARADDAGAYTAEALTRWLTAAPAPVAAAPRLRLAGEPPQHEIDRDLSVYEAWVEVDEALPEVVR